jgi:glycosyltransferase involved in cell wall biosynthesis
MPRVSVIMPAFNCAPFIERALRSALAQTYRDHEIIVVDDGSTDETRQTLAPWMDKVQYFHQANRGLPSARNAAVARASGEYFAYLDADDMWYPDKLEQQVAFLDAHPDCGMVHSEVSFIDEADQILVHAWYRESQGQPARGMCALDLLDALQIQVPTVVERRAAYESTGGFDPRLRRCEDYLHWVQIALNGYAIGFLDRPLAMYRRRSGSLTRSRAAMGEAVIQVFRLLVEENDLYGRLGAPAREVVRRRVAAIRRSLPDFYRWQGRNDLARRRAFDLIRHSPLDIPSYVAFLKACVPSLLAERLRELRRVRRDHTVGAGGATQGVNLG